MNEAQDENPTGDQRGGRAGNVRFEDLARDFWETRPVRSRQDRKLAGVAASLGRRYAVDPVLIRVGFVVGTLYGGAGLLFYLLGWLLLPGLDSGAAPLSSVTRQRHPARWTLAAIALCVFVLGFAVSATDWNGLVSLVLCGAALYLLHHERASRGTPHADDERTATTSESAGDETGASDETGISGQPAGADENADTDVFSTAPAEGATPPRHDEPDIPTRAAGGTGATRYPPDQESSRSTSGRLVTRITIAVALIVGGLSVAITTPDTRTGVVTLLAVVLAVLGVGMLVGSVLRGGRGLILFAVPLALATLVLNSIPQHWSRGMADRQYRPATAAEIQPEYQVKAGKLELDLRGSTIPEGQTVTTRADAELGDVIVRVPPTADVRATCHSELGSVSCLGRTNDGHGAQQVTDTGADGPGDGLLIVNAGVGIGNVEVLRD